MSDQPLLEFLIPTYKRFDGAMEAATSVASQIKSNSLEDTVSIRIVDDASSNFSELKMYESLSEWIDCISIEVNPLNKGMSLNIYDMVSTSNCQFCTVLTDDDWLFPGALTEIISYLRQIAGSSHVGGIFTPRFSYLEDGSLHCVACRPFFGDKLIVPGPVNSLRYCHNGFILTGFIFRSHLMAKDDWKANIENGYFPIINFSKILSSYAIQFVDRNWFHHTVLNVCHWETWGEGDIAQSRRLYIDYMNAIAFIAQRSYSMDRSFFKLIVNFVFEFIHYVRQIKLYSRSSSAIISCNGHTVEKRPAFWLAISVTPVLLLSLRVYSLIRYLVKQLYRLLSSKKIYFPE